MIKGNMEWSGGKRLPWRSALMKIRERGYCQNVLGFETFEAYCKARWDFEKNISKLKRSRSKYGGIIGGTSQVVITVYYHIITITYLISLIDPLSPPTFYPSRFRLTRTRSSEVRRRVIPNFSQRAVILPFVGSTNP